MQKCFKVVVIIMFFSLIACGSPQPVEPSSMAESGTNIILNEDSSTSSTLRKTRGPDGELISCELGWKYYLAAHSKIDYFEYEDLEIITNQFSRTQLKSDRRVYVISADDFGVTLRTVSDITTTIIIEGLSSPQTTTELNQQSPDITITKGMWMAACGTTEFDYQVSPSTEVTLNFQILEESFVTQIPTGANIPAQFLKTTTDSKWSRNGSAVEMLTGSISEVYMSVSLEAYGATEYATSRTISETHTIDVNSKLMAYWFK